MEFVLLWMSMGVVVAIIAGSKGRKRFIWFVYGLSAGPVALVHILALSSTEQAADRRARKDGYVKCPHCAEFMRPEAKVCPHCRRDVVATT